MLSDYPSSHIQANFSYSDIITPRDWNACFVSHFTHYKNKCTSSILSNKNNFVSNSIIMIDPGSQALVREGGKTIEALGVRVGIWVPV